MAGAFAFVKHLDVVERPGVQGIDQRQQLAAVGWCRRVLSKQISITVMGPAIGPRLVIVSDQGAVRLVSNNWHQQPAYR